MTMDGTRTNARRRTHAALAPTNWNGCDESVENVGSDGEDKYGRWRKSHEPKAQDQARRFVRRKGKKMSGIKRVCRKLGNLRVFDVALFVAVASKLASMLYSRRFLSPSTQHDVSMPSPLEPDFPTGEPQSLSDEWHFPKWVKRWKHNQMPFHSPLLYRREDDDYEYSFGYNSYLDDDGDGRSKQKKNVRFRGMFRADSYYNDYKERLNSQGYAVVDEVLYYAEDYRESTLSALNNSEFEVDVECVQCTMDRPAFGFIDGKSRRRHSHYIDDDHWNPYFAWDDDIIRGTRGMGLNKEYMGGHDEEEEEEKEEEEEEEKEEEEGEEESDTEKDICTRPSFYRMYYPTCNEIHASLSGYQWLLGEEIYSRRWKKRKYWSSVRSHLSKYLGHGYYRDAFKFQSTFISYDGKDKPSTQWDQVVFKTMRHMYEGSEHVHADDDEIDSFRFGFDPEDLYTFHKYQDYMRKDALVMELLSSSPRAVDIYSHCSMSSVIEFAPTDMEEYILPTTGFTPRKLMRRGAESKYLDEPFNDHISPEEKLEIALGMAKCIAAMHGLEGGPIAHVDVQITQFFKGHDGFIKLVDYNRAEPLLYDTKNEKYCKWGVGIGDGSLRSPEENKYAPLTEKIDVYSLGNVFYSLLTGKWLREDYDKEESKHEIVEGIEFPIPDIYNELPSSRLLADATRACWTYDVEDRPSIFQVVEFLEEAVAKYPVTEESWV